MRFVKKIREDLQVAFFAADAAICGWRLSALHDHAAMKLISP